MTDKPTARIYEPQELKLLFEALQNTPSYLSKRFVLKHMLGWSEQDLKTNMQLLQEEYQIQKTGQRGY
jgi:biotin operon repressor